MRKIRIRNVNFSRNIYCESMHKNVNIVCNPNAQRKQPLRIFARHYIAIGNTGLLIHIRNIKYGVEFKGAHKRPMSIVTNDKCYNW